MGEGITLEMWQFILGGAGFVVTCVVNTWGVVKYLINRQDKQTAEVFARIEQVQRAAVSREEYTRDSQRLHGELQSVREAVERQGAAQGQRLDSLLLAMGKVAHQ